MTTYLSRDDILAVQDCKSAEVEVPEWGGTVRIRELSASEVESIGLGIATSEGGMDIRRAEGMMAKVVAWAVIDENGKPVSGAEVVTSDENIRGKTNEQGEFVIKHQEAFFTGTAAEITPVREVDGRPVGDGKPGGVTRKLQALFFDVVRGREKKYEDCPRERMISWLESKSWRKDSGEKP